MKRLFHLSFKKPTIIDYMIVDYIFFKTLPLTLLLLECSWCNEGFMPGHAASDMP